MHGCHLQTIRKVTAVKLDIFSDPICPWCYIGKSSLDRALDGIDGHPFEIEWHPFQLNPDMPEGGMDRNGYLEAKFGGKDGALRAYAPIVRTAAEAGLELNLGAIRRTPNTLDAHRLIHWAGMEGCQTEAVDALFQAYFREGRCIGDSEVLARIAEGVGLDAAMVRRLLQSGADAADIRLRDERTREMGVTGVPTFILSQRHVVPGAQAFGFWRRVIAEIASATDTARSRASDRNTATTEKSD